MPKQETNYFVQYRVLDVLVWVTVFFLWKEFYRLTEPKPLIWVFACITTFFSAVTFYLTYYFLMPVFLNNKGIPVFIIAALLTMAILVPVRSGLIYLSFRNVLPGYTFYWNIIKSISASSFHIAYAITLATLIRIFIDRYETQKKLDLITRENLKTELNYLKAQINPHFLFNMYNSIYFLIEENPKMASAALLKLSQIMQYQLYDCSKEMVLLEKEIDNIRNYVSLETMRVEETVKVDFCSIVVNRGQLVAPFILLTLIENAFKHVSKEANNENSVYILLSSGNEYQIEMHIKNTVSGMHTENANGIGLVNVQRRLELLYPGKHELAVSRENGFYNTVLKLQL